MDEAEAYVWLDEIKHDLWEDGANDERVEAVKMAQRLLKEKVTGYSEQTLYADGKPVGKWKK